MSPLLRSTGLWAFSLLLLCATAGSFGYIISFAEAPLSTPVELGGTPDFDPATPPLAGTDGGHVLARIAFIGDIMQHPEQQADDFSRTYEEIGPHLRGYDLVVGNLEFPVDPNQPPEPAPGQIRFNGSPENVRELHRAGVALVTTANNHSFDMGLEGVLSTLEVLGAVGIEGFGTGKTIDDLGPRVLAVGPVRMAFLTYTFPPNVYTDEKGRPIPWPPEWPVNDLYFDDWSGPYREEGLARFSRDVEAARAADADFIIAFVHWGQEWRYAPDRHQRLAARDMVEAGVDLIVGSHAHVLNPAEWVEGKLVAYSLGNFVSAFREMETRTSAVLEVTLVREPGGGVSVGDFAFRPILTSGEDHQVRPLTDAGTGQEERALGFARRIVGGASLRPFPPGDGQH